MSPLGRRVLGFRERISGVGWGVAKPAAKGEEEYPCGHDHDEYGGDRQWGCFGPAGQVITHEQSKEHGY